MNFNKAEFTSAYGLATQLPAGKLPAPPPPGRSNVGKSSLINKLCNRKKLARVSSTPGKTATINFYTAGDAYLVDLPGYGYAKTSASERSRWDSLINGYFSQNRQIPLLLQLLDCRHEPSKDDLGMLSYLEHYQISFIAVLTKFDKIKPSKKDETIVFFDKFLSGYSCNNIIATSAEKGLGIEELQAAMQHAMPAGET